MQPAQHPVRSKQGASLAARLVEKWQELVHEFNPREELPA
jgi:hypothetical protein